MKKEYNFDRILMESQDFNALLSENRTDVYFVAAMTVVALCNYKDDPAKCYEMLGMLTGSKARNISRFHIFPALRRITDILPAHPFALP